MSNSKFIVIIAVPVFILSGVVINSYGGESSEEYELPEWVPGEAIQNYSEGDNIKDHFYCRPTKVGPILRRIGFGVYTGEKRIGSVEVALEPDSTWSWCSSSTRLREDEDYFAEVFGRYPSREGYKIYQSMGQLIFFVEKDNKITEILKYGYKRGWLVHSPVEYMLGEKKRALHVQ